MDKFDEYKLFAESTQYLSERRQNATQTYLSVNTVIFAVLAFVVKDTGLQDWKLVLISLPFFLVGIIACVIWYRIIAQYKDLIGWRYNQLIEMEQAMSESYKMYLKEWHDFFEPRQGKERFGFSRLEAWLPRLFMTLYATFGLALVLATALCWNVSP